MRWHAGLAAYRSLRTQVTPLRWEIERLYRRLRQARSHGERQDIEAEIRATESWLDEIQVELAKLRLRTGEP